LPLFVDRRFVSDKQFFAELKTIFFSNSPKGMCEPALVVQKTGGLSGSFLLDIQPESVKFWFSKIVVRKQYSSVHFLPHIWAS
jgi:hypothetical protein